VLVSPLGSAGEAEQAPRRIVICTTSRGFIGLPCSATRTVGAVRLASEPVSGQLIDSSWGPLVFTDPEMLADELGA
jgi:hypothetical protein